eukprot:TRINITY_DN28197_c0_g1_i1.p1 TRINITY_DN28197_c0_g1~~TRINITY_DN28197_c0_g1_i1.p1  ORF type:complete len:451 (-),score=97.28 TRINITY_DN28197_c0_g1_i1:115-1380(-)
MGKNNKIPQQPRQTPVASASAAAAASVSDSSSVHNAWLASLSPDDKRTAMQQQFFAQDQLDKFKAEQKAKADKAKAAQAQQLWANERAKEREKAWQKDERVKQRQAKQEDRAFEGVKAKAFKESVIEAYDYGDGKWWCQMAGGLWKEIQTEYYCELCDKQLSDCSLEAHIVSKAHGNKVAWRDEEVMKSQPFVPPKAYEVTQPTQPSQPASQLAIANGDTSLPQWIELDREGQKKCIPCNKYWDESHDTTAAHLRKLDGWLEQQKVKRTNYAPPAEPYLAWVEDPSYPGERQLKCLLCSKWVHDDESHSGSFQDPRGSKEHQKNLRNYPPSHPWFQEHVTKVRERWHGRTTVAPSVRVATPQQQQRHGYTAPSSGPPPPVPVSNSWNGDALSGAQSHVRSDVWPAWGSSAPAAVPEGDQEC